MVSPRRLAHPVGMVVRTLAIGMLVLAVVPAAATPEPPLPPGNLAWNWVASPDDGWWVGLSWQAAASSTPVDHYLLYRLDAGGAQEPVVVDGGATEHVDEASSRLGTYVYFLVAVDEGGRMSLPSDPAIVGDEFHCETFGWSIQPPSYTLRPECLPP